VQLQDQGFEPPTDSKTKIEASIDLAILLKVIARLDVIYQEVIRLRYIDGLKPREIAEIMGESANVISVRLHRGLAQLEILLSHERPETKKT
jgi:RNA polymerase sigma factor (sigma-70 family)